MKILIVAFYYPPENTWAKIASLRPASWAKYWSRLGHQVVVLTADKDDESPQSSAINIVGIKYWPSRPNQEVDTQHADIIKGRRKVNLRSLLNSVRDLFGVGSLLQSSDFWLLPAFFKAFSLNKEYKFDVVVSTYGPPANHWVASLLKKCCPHLYWVTDYRDLWHGNDYQKVNFIISKIEAFMERQCIGRANLITTVSDGLAQDIRRLHSDLGQEVITIENGFDSDDLTGFQPIIWPDNKIRLLYSGAIYPGKRDPFPLLKAIQKLHLDREIEEKLEVIFHGWNLEQLQKTVNDYQIDHVVKIKPPLPRTEILRLQRSVHALIFLDWNNPNVKGILTGKIFEYMFSGKPIIGIGSTPETDVGKMILELGIGYPVGFSVENICELLRQLIEKRQLDYNPNQQKIEMYTREKLAVKMIGIIEAKINQGDDSDVPSN